MKIEDYLHFHIGATCKATNKYGAYCYTKISHTLLVETNPITKESKIEPLLRPLVSMTLVERMAKFDSNAEEIKWQLSKDFDIFGLIEEGLAINKIEHPQEQ